MNKINSFYPTQIVQDPHIHTKRSFEHFRNRLDANIKDNIAFKKNLITKQSTECLQQLLKIKEQSQKCKKRAYEQQKEFQDKIQRYIKGDINKWNDYHSYFKSSFDELQQNLRNHKAKNREYAKKINLKKIQLKGLLQQQKQTHVRISSLVKKAQQQSNQTTKQSSVLGKSLSKSKRIKTESSLPLLKPSQYRNDRIKTIQSDFDDEDQMIRQRPKRVMSYMQPIGTLRKKEQSAFPLLIDLLKWYKQKQQNNIGDNWFHKILFSSRHFNKLIFFLQTNTIIRKVQKKL